MRIICFDPGDHTGFVIFNNVTKSLEGGTLLKDNMFNELCDLFKRPFDLVVYESFKLYPGLAKSLSWNSFYPVEVIGMIKLLTHMRGLKCIEQAPSVKKYAGPIPLGDIENVKQHVIANTYTEHTKDALIHLAYFRRFGKV